VIENNSSRIWGKKSGELWSTIRKVGRTRLDPPKSTFSGALGVLAPKYLHMLETDQDLLGKHKRRWGFPKNFKDDRQRFIDSE